MYLFTFHRRDVMMAHTVRWWEAKFDNCGTHRQPQQMYRSSDIRCPRNCCLSPNEDTDTQEDVDIFPLIKYVAQHAVPPSKHPHASLWQMLQSLPACLPACMLTGSGSPANKPVVEKCSYGVKASPVLCHYPAPGRVEGDHHFHITNRRLLFCRQFPQVEN